MSENVKETKQNVLEMKGINKSFFGNQVLTDVSFDVRKGEVHCLLGENGAGKSTLIKILSGAYHCDSGEIFIEGEQLVDNNPSKSIAAGVSVVYQELNMMPDLPIYENVFIGKEFTKGIFFDRKTQIAETKKYLDIVGLDIDPRTIVGNLSIAQQQMVEICKALMVDAKVLIMDEPTDGLHLDDVRRLLLLFNEMTDAGNTLILIEHSLDVMKQADYLVELGPEGGAAGGRLLFCGKPRDILTEKQSITSTFLWNVSKNSSSAAEKILRRWTWRPPSSSSAGSGIPRCSARPTPFTGKAWNAV